MATKIRLQRQGRKKRAFFHIVVADSRAPRDGKYIEKIGSYNPITNPATIELNLERATEWLLSGAQTSDTARAILSYKGAAYKKHLQVGVNKGAITQEIADERFALWTAEKASKVDAKKSNLSTQAAKAKDAGLVAESKRRAAVEAKLADKLVQAAASANAAELAALNTATEDIADTATQDIADIATEDIADIATEDIADTATEDIADIATEDIADTATEDIADTATEDIADTATEDIADTATEEVLASEESPAEGSDDKTPSAE